MYMYMHNKPGLDTLIIINNSIIGVMGKEIFGNWDRNI